MLPVYVFMINRKLSELIDLQRSQRTLAPQGGAHQASGREINGNSSTGKMFEPPMPSKKSEIMGDGTKDMMGDGSKPGVGAGGDSSKADPMATLAADLASLRATVESRLPKKAAYNDLAQISGGQITPNAVVAR